MDRAPEELRDDLALCFGTGLRTSEMSRLRASHFSSGRGGLHIRVPTIHDPKSSKRAAPLSERHRVHPVAQAVYKARVQRHKSGKRANEDFKMCGKWDGVLGNKWIKRASVALGWTKCLKWPGVHCLRHGLAVSMAGADNDVTLAAEYTGHRSRACAGRYAATNDNRVARAAKKNAARKKRAKSA